ncbi:hypothetical protein [Natronorubrum halophilum]|uniref:hypothetical protein n=1 Tax=Natronorubrum halophilum TaxID=1702106 RepID=UPI0013CEFDFD|nr:hypothetical protein [Natronorubrum halophilum]
MPLCHPVIGDIEDETAIHIFDSIVSLLESRGLRFLLEGRHCCGCADGASSYAELLIRPDVFDPIRVVFEP